MEPSTILDSQVVAGFWDLALLPVVAALIGWITNYVAVKMLFHPRKPVRFLFITIQGVFPKRQAAVAEKLGRVVATELLSSEDIHQGVQKVVKSPDFLTRVAPEIERFVMEVLPKELPMLAMFLTPQLVEVIKGAIMKMFDPVMDQVLSGLQAGMAEEINIEKIVTEKVTNFSSDKLEEILFAIMRKEFKFIELVGGVLGFVIGLVQVAMICFVG